MYFFIVTYQPPRKIALELHSDKALWGPVRRAELLCQLRKPGNLS